MTYSSSQTVPVKQFLAQKRLLKWNTHPIPLIYSERLLAVSKNTQINVTMTLKAIPQ